MKAAETGPKVLTQTLAIPLRKGTGTGQAPGVRMTPKLQDLMDPGFHLHRTQLLKGGAVGAAWS
jgi:hypothetical protein